MNALVTIEPTRNVELWRASTDAASMCKDIVVKRAINLQGKRYVPVEGWQAIALAHGCVASSENVRRVEGGYSAEGVIRNMATGQEVARAEGFVGEDEPVWFGGKSSSGKTLPRRPDFAIRAMAQTRGISRACRSAFAHVVVMMDVGLETTPAEEMTGVYDYSGSAPSRPTPSTPVAQRARDLKPQPASEPEMPALRDDSNPGRMKAEDWLAGHLSAIADAADLEALDEVTAAAAKALAKLAREYPDLRDRAVAAVNARAAVLSDDAPDPRQALADEVIAAAGTAATIIDLNALRARHADAIDALPEDLAGAVNKALRDADARLKGGK